MDSACPLHVFHAMEVTLSEALVVQPLFTKRRKWRPLYIFVIGAYIFFLCLNIKKMFCENRQSESNV